MDIHYCIKCSSHYMNGDDEWCDYHDSYCKDCPDNCDNFEEWDY